MSARTKFCHHCGAQGVHKFGKDRQRRQRYKCNHCFKIFTKRTRTHKSGSQLSDEAWKKGLELFCLRAGCSAADLSRFLNINKKTAQKMNRHFCSLVKELEPSNIDGVSEWDEAIMTKQWVIGGVSRNTRQCLLKCIPNRREMYLSGFVNTYSDPEAPFVCTDEHLGYIGVVNRLTVCHANEYVHSKMTFVHTNQIEGVWGHLKPLGKHIYRGFPRSTLPMYLSEFMFRYNIRDYNTRVAILTALLQRKTNSLLV